MEEHNILDEMISEDQVEILKAAMPYLPAQGQRFISVYAKFLELSNTIRLFSRPQADMQMHAQEQFTADPLEMLSACSKVCHGPLKEKLENITNTFLMIQMLDLDNPQKGGAPFHE